MNISKTIYIFLILLPFLFACQEEAVESDGVIDDTERAIMTECSANLLTSKIDIEQNLIGEWQLIGHGTTLFQTFPQPNIYLTISEDELIFDYKNTNTTRLDTISWEIEEYNSSAGQSFLMNVTPNYTELVLFQFCENYMFGETSSINDGGNMYLYEKVK